MATGIQEYKDTGIKGDSEIVKQNHKATGIQGYKDKGIQGYRDTWIQIQDYRDTWIRGYRDTGIQLQLQYLSILTFL